MKSEEEVTATRNNAINDIVLNYCGDYLDYMRAIDLIADIIKSLDDLNKPTGAI